MRTELHVLHKIVFVLYIQARSQGGFEGVRPACSLVKFIFNETAAIQGTIIQPCSGIVTDSLAG